MTQAIISSKDGFVYIKRDAAKNEQEIKNHLSNIKPLTEGKFGAKMFSLYWESKGYLKLPRIYGLEQCAKNGIIPANKMIVSSMGPNFGKEGDVILRDYQLEAIDIFLKHYHSSHLGGILKAGCGSGKTLTSCRAIRSLGKRALIITNGDDPIDTWGREFKREFPDLEVPALSRLKGREKRLEVLKDRDIPILITCHKTLMNGTFEPADFDGIDLIVMDEVHEYIAEKTLSIFDLISRRYILGLSATPTKPNGLEFLLGYYIGPIIYEYESAYKGVLPVIHKVSFDVSHIHLDKTLPYTKIQELILGDKKRKELICSLVLKYNSLGKKILVLGLLREQLESYKELIEQSLPSSCTLYYSMTSKKDKEKRRKEVQERPIILAIRQMGAQSLNIPDLNCMILASKYIPKNDGANTEKIDQMCGRVLRRDHEVAPIIVNVVDKHFYFLKQERLCRAYFEGKGYKYDESEEIKEEEIIDFAATESNEGEDEFE